MASMYWQVALDALEAWLRADAGFAALVTHARGDTTVVDIAQGRTAAMDPPCARLHRGPQGDSEATTYRGALAEIPATFTLFLDLHAPDVPDRDDDLSATEAWGALAAIEAEAMRCVRAFFAPSRPMTSILGAPYWCILNGPNPVGEEYHPAVASRLTITLNKIG